MSHLSTKMSPSSLSLRCYHMGTQQVQLEKVRSLSPQLNGNLCPLLDQSSSWRIHSRILVFDTLSHHTQSISPEGWPRTLNEYCIPSKKVLEALWHGHVCHRGEKLKSHLSMSDS